MSSGRVLQKSVDRLSLLDGIVVAVGWCEGNAVPQIVVDGKVVPVQTSLRYERPDVARVHGRGFKIGEPTVTWEADPSSIYDLGYSH